MVKKKKEEELFAFVVMPFDKKFKDLYLYGIKGTAESLNIRAERLDEQIYQEGMLERIYRQIDVADIVIADMSDKNPNVFYEVGYAHAKGKLCILLTSQAEDIPFDLKHKRHIVHNGEASTLSELLKTELLWAKEEIKKARDSRISVDFKTPTGVTKVGRYHVDAELNFVIELRNNSDRPSPEIDHAYFLCSDRWEVSQNGKVCPSARADDGRTMQHFVEFPVKRLQKGAWARLSLDATRVMADGAEGDELETEYRLKGALGLLLVTSEGSFTYSEYMDIEIDDLPF
ncbi:TIR domain-containing protein [Cupriavidus metallidurans]|uniref:hypothetical protein n=1 Tax=Cupriavidus metallidurans TaxID=119219 RepID=UPI000AA31F8C|nr:hypothetical protein [Cupriavidus metallidurans]